MATETDRKTRLQKLSGSDYEIADGQPDIRDWDVKDSAGNKLGEVDELIFDYESRKVRYLVVDVDSDATSNDSKEVLVPIGIAELHESDDDVILPGVTAAQLSALPEYAEDRFDTEHETSVRNVFGGLGGAALAGGSNSDFYNHEHFNEENLYRNRKGASGETQSGTSLLRDKQAVALSGSEDEWEENDTPNSDVLRKDVREYDAVPVAGSPLPLIQDASLLNDDMVTGRNTVGRDNLSDIDDADDTDELHSRSTSKGL